MPVKNTIPFSEGIFSITFTCARWLPLIEMVNGYDIVYKWFDHLKSKGHFICGYMIMPNHVHVLIGFRNIGQAINTIVGNGKHFMAYEIKSDPPYEANLSERLPSIKDGIAGASVPMLNIPTNAVISLLAIEKTFWDNNNSFKELLVLILKDSYSELKRELDETDEVDKDILDAAKEKV